MELFRQGIREKQFFYMLSVYTSIIESLSPIKSPYLYLVIVRREKYHANFIQNVSQFGVQTLPRRVL